MKKETINKGENEMDFDSAWEACDEFINPTWEETPEPGKETQDEALRQAAPILDRLISTLSTEQLRDLGALLTHIEEVNLSWRLEREDQAFKFGWHYARGDLSALKALAKDREKLFGEHCLEYVFGIEHQERCQSKYSDREVEGWLYYDIGDDSKLPDTLKGIAALSG